MKEELKSLGLTDGEVEVYLTLLKLGPSTNSPIARHAGLQSSSVYYCLNSLIEKGFVTYIIQQGRKHFSAVNPDTLLEILEEKQKSFSEQKIKVSAIIPQLKASSNVLKENTSAEVLEGLGGFQSVFRSILKELKKGGQYEAFVIEQAFSEPEEIRNVFIHHNKELKKREIKLRLLAPESLRPVFERIYGKKFLQSYQEIRYTSQITPAGITVYKDTVVIHLSEEDKPISIRVRNPKLALMYHEYFDSVWKTAKI